MVGDFYVQTTKYVCYLKTVNRINKVNVEYKFSTLKCKTN